MKEPSWLVRIVECFSNETDEFVCEFALPPIALSQLQEKWNQPTNEPMVGSFLVEEEQAKFLSELAEIEFDFIRYSYFLSAYTTDWEAAQLEGGYMGLFPPPKELAAFLNVRRRKPK